MAKLYYIRGIVEQEPALSGAELEFPLRSAGDLYYIIRLDPSLQRKDLLFLNTGQAVEIIGTPHPDTPHRIHASRITIANYPISRLLQREGE